MRRSAFDALGGAVSGPCAGNTIERRWAMTGQDDDFDGLEDDLAESGDDAVGRERDDSGLPGGAAVAAGHDALYRARGQLDEPVDRWRAAGGPSTGWSSTGCACRMRCGRSPRAWWTRPTTPRCGRCRTPLGGAIATGVNGLLSGLLPFQHGRRDQPGAGDALCPWRRRARGRAPSPMRGGIGLMGEAGPEAILPLARGADGRLGVASGGGGGPSM
jgi:hypothetical protein